MVQQSDKSINWIFLRNYIEIFLIYCFLGWVYESIWCDVIYHRRGFLNRGFLWGPWLPIYGIGFFIIFGILTLFKIKRPIMVFISGTVIATSAELIASYILEMITGDYMWDYTGYFLNYDGRIALVPGLMFGLLIYAAICHLQPFIIRLQQKYQNSRIHNTGFLIVSALFIADLICRIWFGNNFKSR